MAKSGTLRIIRLVAWGAVALVALVAGAFMLGELQQAARQGASLPGAARIGGAFELTDQDGKSFSSEQLKGRPHIVFFGFTHCPDICPTTLLELSKLLESLGEDADKLGVLFITVDPARDTPENLKSYLASFDPRITGLTGTSDQIKKVTNLYRAVYEKVPSADGTDYTMNHTASVYLIDRSGALSSTLAWGEDAETQRKKLLRLVAK
jgi:protein SCO1